VQAASRSAVTGGDTVRPTFFERAAQGFGLALALLIVPVVVAIETVPSIWPPNGLTQAQYAFCARDHGSQVFGGPDFVADAAWDYAGNLPDYRPPWGFRDPQWASACRYAFVVAGLSGDQSVWCADPPNRARVAQAVDAIGAEGDGPGYSPPGDSPAEYVQACRIAYDYLRPVPAVSITPDSPAFALTSSESRYCDEIGAQAVDSVLVAVGLGPTQHPTAVQAAENRAVGCRLAFIEANWGHGGY
jgi:hypothetical protein